MSRIFRSRSYFIKGINPTRTWASSGKVLLRLEQQMRRREFITLLGGAAAAWPLAARAQQPPMTVKQARVGVLAVSPPTPAMSNAFREGMRERGYIEGQNLSIDVRWSQGTIEQISALAAEFVSANVQVIVAWATPSVIAARPRNVRNSHRYGVGRRSGGFGVRHQSGATRWKYHRFQWLHGRSQRQADGAIRRACPQYQARRHREQFL